MNLVYTVFIYENWQDPIKLNALEKCIKSQKIYADRIGAEYYCQTQHKMNLSTYNNDEKLYIYFLLQKYDHVLYLDADVMVKPSAPDIFKQYEGDDRIRMLNETCYNHTIVSRSFMPAILARKQEIKETTLKIYEQERVLCYFNVGVILASSKFKNLFKITDDYMDPPYWRADQDFVNYRVWKQWQEAEFDGEFITNLPIAWNGMLVYDQHAAVNCHFVHYAGQAYYTKASDDYDRLFASS